MKTFNYSSEDKEVFEKIIEPITKKMIDHKNNDAYRKQIVEQVKKLQREKQLAFIACIFEKNYEYEYYTIIVLESVIASIFKPNINLTDEEIVIVFTLFHSMYNKIVDHDRRIWSNLPWTYFLKQIECTYKNKIVEGKVKEALLIMKEDILLGYGEEKKRQKFIEKIDSILLSGSTKDGKVKPERFYNEENDRFAKYINNYIATLETEEKNVWYKLIAQFKNCNQAKPSAKFNKKVCEIINASDKAIFRVQLLGFINYLINLKTLEEHHVSQYNNRTYEYTTYEFISSINAGLCKGMIWSSIFVMDEEIILALTKLVERCYEKIPGQGATSAGLGNTCLYALTQAQGFDGVSALSRLRLRIRQKNTQSIIEKYLDEAAKLRGVTVSDLEDMAVPDFGLTI